MPADPDALTCPCDCHGRGPGAPCTIEGGCGHLHRHTSATRAKIPAGLEPSTDGQPRCEDCGKPTGGDGAFLCAGCTADLRGDLRTVEDLWPEVTTTRTKQDRISAGGGGRSTTAPLPFRPAAMRSADRLQGYLAAWVRDIAASFTSPTVDLPHADDVAGLAAWLLAEIEAIRRHPGAGSCAREIHSAVRGCFRSIDRPPEKAYAGPCDTDGCPEDLYGVVTASTLTCRGCGARYDLAPRRAWLLDALREHLATAAEIAAGIGELYGEPINRKRINQWHSRGRLLDAGVTLDTHDVLFRIGDVLDLAVGNKPPTRPGHTEGDPASA